jgi:hypothetical protein
VTEIDPPKPTLEDILREEKARRCRPVDWDDMSDARARIGKRLGAIRERNAALRGEPLEPELTQKLGRLAPDLHEKIAKRIRELLERSHSNG